MLRKIRIVEETKNVLLIQQQTVSTTPDENGNNTGVSITEIKNNIDGCYVANGVDHSKNRKKRPYVGRNRHPNWRVIGEYAELNHWKAAIQEFSNDFQDCTPHAAEIRCSRWAKQWRYGHNYIDTRKKTILGAEFELKLLNIIN